MIEIGKLNRLKIVKEVDFGLYLDGYHLGEILIPKRYVPKNCNIGDDIQVFIYKDSEDRLIATTEKPYVMVEECACLKVVSTNRAGAFLDWGLPKDLLVPFSEQKPAMEEGKRYVVAVYLDEETDRIVASARLNDFLDDEANGDFSQGDAVNLFVANRSDLGYKMIINNSHWGLLHHQEVLQPLKRGQHLKGFVSKIRDDDRIDLSLHIKKRDKTDDAVAIIMRELTGMGGFIAVTDKSTPGLVQDLFGISKGMYKKAIGSLYKRKMIVIEKEGIRLVVSK
ncbi:MAG: S1-like domain-containing RNA-binding protein [Mariprofundaceae bacterium]|nr:S1-like domain-containing RNA-binding protein [Mariprofundaceae bacterium]